VARIVTGPTDIVAIKMGAHDRSRHDEKKHTAEETYANP
jgi:hypothetical protein